MDNVPQSRYVVKPTYLSEKSEFFVSFSFLFFITYSSNGHMDRADPEIPFSSIFARKRSTKFSTRATHHQTTFPGFLSFSTSLSLCCCGGRRVVEKAGNEDCNVTEGILNCFTPSQEPVLPSGWLKKER